MQDAKEIRYSTTRDSWGRPVTVAHYRMTDFNEFDRCRVEVTSTEGGWAGSVTRADYEALRIAA